MTYCKVTTVLSRALFCKAKYVQIVGDPPLIELCHSNRLFLQNHRVIIPSLSLLRGTYHEHYHLTEGAHDVPLMLPTADVLFLLRSLTNSILEILFAILGKNCENYRKSGN
jgi:hypothetical protein